MANQSIAVPNHANGISLLRFFLAFLVFYHHTLYFSHDDSLRFGPAAVIAFYIVSGYLNGRSIENFKHKTSIPVRYFLMDRFLRMAPVSTVVALTALLVLIVFRNHELNLVQFFSNLLILPLAFSKIHPSFEGYVNMSWTLGTEYAFYCIFPLFLMLTVKMQKIVTILCSVVYAVVFFFGSFFFRELNQTGLQFNTNIVAQYCYFLPFLTFWFFAAGEFLRRGDKRTLFWLAAISIVFLVIYAAYGLNGNRAIPFGKMLLFGWFLGFPLLMLVRHIKFTGFLAPIVTFLGDLTLPLYLGHGLGRLIAGSSQHSLYSFKGMVLMWTLTLFITLALYLCDKKFNLVRYRFRQYMFSKYPKLTETKA